MLKFKPETTKSCNVCKSACLLTARQLNNEAVFPYTVFDKAVSCLFTSFLIRVKIRYFIICLSSHPHCKSNKTYTQM